MIEGRKRWGAWLLLLLALAAGLRLYRLGTLPAGLHHDEAAYGLQALEVLGGSTPVFFSSFAGREAGFLYLVAPSVALLGRSILAVRLPAALLGVVLVAALALVGRRCLGRGGALLAAGAAAGAPWLLHVNRIGFRANTLPVLLTLWAWLLLRALHSNRRRDWLGAGLCLGLTAYTYLAARIVPLLVLLFLLYLACWQRPLLRRCASGLVLMLALALLLLVPLALHFVRVPEDWQARTSQVSACSQLAWDACLVRLADQLWRTLLMVGVRGDPLLFFNLPERPALPAALGWLFYVGLLVALRRWRQPALAFCLLWWLVLVLPGVLSADSPHFLRTIGAAPPTMLLWSLGAISSGELIGKRWPRTSAWHGATAGALLLLIALLSARDYFLRWARHPQLFYATMEYATRAARQVQSIPPSVDLYISEAYYRHPTYLYLSDRAAQASWFDAHFGWPQARPGRSSSYFISFSTPTDERAEPFIAGAEGQSMVDERGQYGYTVLHLPSGLPQPPAPAHQLAGLVGGLQLEGVTPGAARPGEQLELTLFWRVREPARADLRVFAHLLDDSGQLLAQQDAIGYPSPEWRAGDRFASFVRIALPPGLPAGRYRLALGLYDVRSGARQPVAGPAASGDSLLLPLAISSSGLEF